MHEGKLRWNLLSETSASEILWRMKREQSVLPEQACLLRCALLYASCHYKLGFKESKSSNTTLQTALEMP